MKTTTIVAGIALAAGCADAQQCSNTSSSASDLTVRTITGTYVGLQDSNYSSVREFRDIPYAQPPTGSLRFLPPQPLPPSNKKHYSYRYPPSCPQFVSTGESFWNTYGTQYLPQNAFQNDTTGLPLLTGSEDCLHMAIWTPLDVAADAKLPVAFWMPGGGFSSGGVDVAGQMPAHWVNRTQGHIVVSINYRVNIFGFPNSAGTDSPNVGILDQRLALEWVASNIAAFGGDPENIMIWGQSAGSQSVDYHNYAFWDNPISAKSFSQSGTAIKALSSSDFAQSNFTYVAKQVGCDFPDNAQAELECMQVVSAAELSTFLGNYNNSAGRLSFGPIADEVLIFSNYSDRAAKGYISPNPAIFSDAANNDATLSAWPVNNQSAGPYEPAIVASTLQGWVCPTANTSIIRAAANVTTFRVQYAGNFSNLTPFDWLGAYHSSDNAMYHGTYVINVQKPLSTAITPLEVQTSEIMQDHLLAFMKDAVEGPKAYGWAPYTYGGQVIRYGGDGIAAQNVSGYEIDGPCFGNGTYNPYP